MTDLSPRYKWLLILILSGAGIIFSCFITINDDAMDLLPGKAVQGDLKILQRLGLVDRIFITLSADPTLFPDEKKRVTALKQSSEQLAKSLGQHPVFSSIIYRLPKGYELSMFKTIQPNLPLLLDQHDLEAVDRLTTPPALDQAMRNNFSLLNSPAGIGIKQQIQQDPLGIIRILLAKLEHLRIDFSLHLVDGFFISKDNSSCLIMTESKESLTDAKQAEKVEILLNSSFPQSLLPGVQARVIGTLPHTLANSRSIQHDLKILLPVATLILLCLLAFTLRDIRVFLVMGIPFLAAPPAIAITTVIFGRISGLGLGFGIVLLGIAVDFAIHLFLALRDEPGSQQQILAKIKRPVLLASMTTTSVFLVLLFSQIPSHRQMATLALAGTVLAVFFSWQLIPLVCKKKGQGQISQTEDKTSRKTISTNWQRLFFILWLILLTAGALSWPRLQYNGNLQALDAPSQQILDDEEFFRATWGQQGEQAFVVSSGKTLDLALEANSQVYATLIANKSNTFQSIAPILPGESFQQKNQDGWQQFWQKKQPDFEQLFLQSADKYGFSQTAFIPFFTFLENRIPPLKPDILLTGPMQPILSSMIRTPLQQRITTDETTAEYLIMTTVSTTPEIYQQLLTLDNSSPNITLLANQKWRNQVEKLLRKDILTLSLGAACIIILLTSLVFKQLRLVLAVLAPVLSALAAMSLFSFISSGELNMMHVLMGIMVIGLSVDYGIFIISSQQNSVSSVTPRAVSICAASSLIGFGVLSFASHPALHSLGITVLVGIGSAWPTALLITPFLARSPYEQKRED